MLSTEAEILGSAGELVSALKMFNRCVLPLCQCAQLVGLHVLRNTNLLIFSSLEALRVWRLSLLTDVGWGLFCTLYIQPLEYMQPTSGRWHYSWLRCGKRFFVPRLLSGMSPKSFWSCNYGGMQQVCISFSWLWNSLAPQSQVLIHEKQIDTQSDMNFLQVFFLVAQLRWSTLACTTACSQVLAIELLWACNTIYLILTAASPEGQCDHRIKYNP